MMTEDSPQQVNQPQVVNSAKNSTHSILQSKNVRIHDRRTSVRLEPEMWAALKEISQMEGCSIHDLCGAVHDLKEEGTSFTAALRVFLMEYYRAASKSSPQVALIQRRLKGETVAMQPAQKAMA